MRPFAIKNTDCVDSVTVAGGVHRETAVMGGVEGSRPETARLHFTISPAFTPRARTVARHTLESLAMMLCRYRADDSVAKAIGRLIRADLIVIDDIGMLPVAPDAAAALFRIVDAAYEKTLDRAHLEHPPSTS